MRENKFAIFGSAFDPPTQGHQDVLQQVASYVDTILLVPSFSHAFGKRSQPFEQRCELVRLFIKDLSLPCTVELSDIEQTLYQDKPVYTFDLMCAVEAQYPDAQLIFVRGPDNATPEVWQRFYNHREIEQRWTLFTATERRAVRSTAVRQELSQSVLNRAALQTLLTPTVMDYLLNHPIYQDDQS